MFFGFFCVCVLLLFFLYFLCEPSAFRTHTVCVCVCVTPCVTESTPKAFVLIPLECVCILLIFNALRIEEWKKESCDFRFFPVKPVATSSRFPTNHEGRFS